MTSKLENCTHFLDRAKRELLGYGKRGPSKGTHLLKGQRSDQVRIWKERKLVRGTHLLEMIDVSYDMETSKISRKTHFLEGAEVKNDQITERKLASRANSQTGEDRDQSWSEYKNKAKAIRSTDFLKKLEVRTDNNIESRQASKMHSLPRGSRGQN